MDLTISLYNYPAGSRDEDNFKGGMCEEGSLLPARPRRHITFSASAGCFTYLLGIAAFIQSNYDLTDCTFSGASGGAWSALLLAAERDIDYCFELLCKNGPQAMRPSVFGPYGQFHVSVSRVFEDIFNGIDVRRLVRDKLSITLTRLAWTPLPHLKCEIVRQFFSNQDVLDCIVASAAIPLVVNGKVYVRYRDWVCFDAAMTNVTGALWALQQEEQEEQDGRGRLCSGDVDEYRSPPPSSFSSFLPLCSGCREYLDDLIALFSPRPVSAACISSNGSCAYEPSRPFGLSALMVKSFLSVAAHLVSSFLDPVPTDCSAGADACSTGTDSVQAGGEAVDADVVSEPQRVRDHGPLWHESMRGNAIKSGSDALVLEIAPWTFRPMPLSAYALSKDPAVLTSLYELGKQDAALHVAELSLFFNSF